MGIYGEGFNYIVLNKTMFSGGGTGGVAPHNVEITLTAQDILNGYAVLLSNPSMDAGAKADTEMFPRHGLPQEYGQDYTAIVSDNRLYFYLIWSTSGVIPDINSPVYPVNGLTSLLAEGDVIDIVYYD